jgi:predicted  nucleic acid-binding Zn-ribbon protein
LHQLLEDLIELQRLDKSLQNIENIKGDLPVQVNRLKQELESAERNVADQENQLVSLRKDGATNDVDLKQHKENLKRYQDQLYKVKSNREYDAVTKEIETVETLIRDTEYHGLELDESIENTDKSLAELKTVLEQVKAQYAERSAELEAKRAETEADETRLLKERETLARGFKPPVIAAYNRIRRAKTGLAVVQVLRGACGGCYKALPPQRILEVRQMNRLILCDVCGRILIWKESAEPST